MSARAHTEAIYTVSVDLGDEGVGGVAEKCYLFVRSVMVEEAVNEFLRMLCSYAGGKAFGFKGYAEGV